jgi:hypothetical protein
MKYALLVYTQSGSFASLSEEEQQRVSAQYWAVRDVPGVFDGAQLHPVEAATTVRVEDGRTLTTDGPFADTKEVFGGYYLMEADDLDAAIHAASKVPSTWMGGSVEIRPIVEYS